MAPSLREIVEPGRTALVTSECQRNVIGDLARLPHLADAARGPVVETIARLVRSARAARVLVAHCVFGVRADGLGYNRNARLFLAARKAAPPERRDVRGAELIPEIGVEESDLVLARHQGLSPMAGTELDAMLRNTGIETIVGVGVSVNVALLGFAFDAVNHGYRFVIARDAVAGVPREYADAVLGNTLSLLATITTADELIEAWREAG